MTLWSVPCGRPSQSGHHCVSCPASAPDPMATSHLLPVVVMLSRLCSLRAFAQSAPAAWLTLPLADSPRPPHPPHSFISGTPNTSLRFYFLLICAKIWKDLSHSSYLSVYYLSPFVWRFQRAQLLSCSLLCASSWYRAQHMVGAQCCKKEGKKRGKEGGSRRDGNPSLLLLCFSPQSFSRFLCRL